MKENQFEMAAKTLYGLEEVLADELKVIGADEVKTGRRMVSFSGDKAMLYKANFHCRTALRILKPIARFKADHADVVYREVKKIDWDAYLSPDKTFAVDAVVYSEMFNHSKFVAYRTKDAIADYFNDKYEKRPSVRVHHPDLYINVHISHDECTVSLDSSGESLHKRGYRVAQVEAPLNEVLAAGMILRTGWQGKTHFVDPMCGSGTLLIEAAMIALNMAPGVFRKEYAFERWPDFDRELLDEIYNDESAEREFDFKCYGSDISPAAIEKAMKNVRSAGLSKYIDLTVMPFQQTTEAPRPGLLVMNPPYGERISSDDIMELYSMIGERLKHVFFGYEAWILSYKDECFDKIGLRPKHRIKLMNGDLECEYRCYELFEGKNNDYKKDLRERDDRRAERNFSAQQPAGLERRAFRRDGAGRSSSSFGRDGADRSNSSSDRDGSGRMNSSFRRDGAGRTSSSFDRDGAGRTSSSFGRDGADRAKSSSDRDGSGRMNSSFRRDGAGGRSKSSFDRDGAGRSSSSFGRDDKPFVKGYEASGKNRRTSAVKAHDRFDKDRKPPHDRKFSGKESRSFGKNDKPYDRNRKSFKKDRYED